MDLILEGEKFDEAVYDQMIKDRKISRRLKASKTKLIEDMNGVLSPVQIKMIRELRKHIDELEKHIRELDQDINDAMSDPEKEAAKRLTQIPGIGEDSAKIIITVIGVDMSRFPTDRHICSWAGICRCRDERCALTEFAVQRRRRRLHMIKRSEFLYSDLLTAFTLFLSFHLENQVDKPWM